MGALRTSRNLARLIGVARTLARHDALFALETLALAPFLVAPVRAIWRPKRGVAGLRPG